MKNAASGVKIVNGGKWSEAADYHPLLGCFPLGFFPCRDIKMLILRTPPINYVSVFYSERACLHALAVSQRSWALTWCVFLSHLFYSGSSCFFMQLFKKHVIPWWLKEKLCRSQSHLFLKIMIFLHIISPFGTKGTSMSSIWFSILVVGHPLFAHFCISFLLYTESQSVCWCLCMQPEAREGVRHAAKH